MKGKKKERKDAYYAIDTTDCEFSLPILSALSDIIVIFEFKNICKAGLDIPKGRFAEVELAKRDI